eukprot:c16843_g1_i1 orf=201-833(+)
MATSVVSLVAPFQFSVLNENAVQVQVKALIGRQCIWTNKPQNLPRTSGKGLGAKVHCSLNSAKISKTARETVVLDPDYRIPIILLSTAAGFIYADNLLPAGPIGLLGLLLLFQTTRVRFVFDDDAMEVRIGNQLQNSGENVFVGGENRWKYSTFVNWELWWPSFPVLVYFKEIQTRPEGQVHFFPVIFNGKQLYSTMVERCGSSQNSAPK